MQDLPPDPADALITLADRAQVWLNDPDEGPHVNTERVYIESILKSFIQRYAPDLIDFELYAGSPKVAEFVEAIVGYAGQREVHKLLDDYEAKREAIVEGFGYARLDDTEKAALRDHLERIRTIVDDSDLDARKKTALFERINGLQEEVDKDGTRTDRFFAFAGDAAFVLSEMAEKAQPFLKEVKDILKLVGEARAKEERVKLPGQEDTLFLPPADAATDEGEDA